MNNEHSVASIPGFTSASATVGGVRLHYWIGGDPDGAPQLAEAGLRVLVPDMRGFGDSDKPEGTDGYDARALAEEFRALVAETVRSVLIPDSGHFVPEERPAEIVRHVLETIGPRIQE